MPLDGAVATCFSVETVTDEMWINLEFVALEQVETVQTCDNF